MTDQLTIGDVLTDTITFTDAGGSVTDPSSVRLDLILPNGSTVTYTYGTDPQIVRSSSGVYVASVRITLAGIWMLKWYASGVQQASEWDRVIVSSDPFSDPAYLDVEHVEAYTPGRAPFDATTSPTRDRVQQLLLDASAEIDMALTDAGYALPIATSATAAYRLVQAACAKCAAAAVEDVAPTRDENTRKATRAMCDAAKKMIAAGGLPGVEIDDSGSARPRSGYGATAFFTRDMTL